MMVIGITFMMITMELNIYTKVAAVPQDGFQNNNIALANATVFIRLKLTMGDQGLATVQACHSLATVATADIYRQRVN